MPQNRMSVEAVHLYRAFLRVAHQMPNYTRANFIRRKVRHEFDIARLEKDSEKVQFLLKFGWTQLDSAKVQATHLNSLKDSGYLNE